MRFGELMCVHAITPNNTTQHNTTRGIEEEGGAPPSALCLEATMRANPVRVCVMGSPL